VEKMEKRNKGIIFILMSSLFFALMAALVKYLGNIPTVEKIFFRNLIATVTAFVIVKKNGKSLVGNNIKLLLLRSSFGLLGIAAYFYALSQMKLSDAVILNKMSPFFVVVFASIFLKEKISKMQMAALIIAAVGAVFVIRPGFDSNIFPALIALLSSLFAGIAYTIVRELRKTDSAAAVVFYFSLFSTIVIVPFMLTGGFVVPAGNDILALAALGIFAAAAQLFMTNAYRHAEASELSIYTYANIVFSSFFGLLFFQEIPDIITIIGGVLIITAGYINYRSKKLNSLTTKLSSEKDVKDEVALNSAADSKTAAK
jgi:drug/metabolite transporter (DMT)-like permease